MTQRSLPWTDNSIGDGHAYTDAEWWALYKAIISRYDADAGVLAGARSEYVMTHGGTTPLVVQPGSCIVDGTIGDSDANENITVPTPSVSTRIDRLVVRKDFAAQTARLYLLQGAEGGGAPALQQVAGNLWDIPLWQISTTTGGVVTTVADEREFAQFTSDLAYPLINPGGRLTYISGTPASDLEVSAITTLYYTPWKSNRIPLYSNGKWHIHTFSEISMSLAGLAANTLFDVFAYKNATGGVSLSTLAWSNSGAGTSARATNLTYQDGYKVLTGDATKLYLGTFRTIGTIGQSSDNVSQRLLFNFYNRFRRRLFASLVAGASGIIKTTNVWEAFFGNTTVGQGRVEVVIGVQEGVPIFVESLSYLFTNSYAGSGTPSGSIGIGLDVTNADSVDSRTGGTITASISAVYSSLFCRGNYYPADGFHFLQRLYIGGGGGTTYFYSDASPTNAAHHKCNLTGDVEM